ncbi:MAG: hypothetical protein WD042_04595 [Phycisphaeraceae bacterium]
MGGDAVGRGQTAECAGYLLELGPAQLLVDCKTVTKKPPLIGKDEAFAVLQKASDFDPKMRQITLGKPDFDEHSKIKAAASPG